MALLSIDLFRTVWLGPLNTCTYVISQKREIVILKLDFEKAFDKVEHQWMLNIMESKGLPMRWLSWMRGVR